VQSSAGRRGAVVRCDNPLVTRYDSILGAIGNTPLVGIDRMSSSPSVRIWAKLEGNNPTGSTKDRIALKMVEVAEESGELTPDKTILEPTSGNTGIALAMVARRKGYRLTVVIPDNASEERIGLLRLFGADIVFSDGQKGTNGSIEVARALAQDDRYYMPFQYGNPANPKAHEEGTAQEIIRDLPTVTHFIAGMGTGGTLTGSGRGLHAYNPDIKVIAAEPELGDLVYGLRSLDEGFIPPIFDPEQIDRKFLVNAVDSLRATRELTAREGVFAGISSGAVIHVAQRISADLDEGDIVCLLPDGGWKYLSTEAWAEDLATAEKGVEESLWW
jgi:[CysO sulfur-carrier protein]-thiocarboxylate-dependent cysteine synthase